MANSFKSSVLKISTEDFLPFFNDNIDNNSVSWYKVERDYKYSSDYSLVNLNM